MGSLDRFTIVSLVVGTLAFFLGFTYLLYIAKQSVSEDGPVTFVRVEERYVRPSGPMHDFRRQLMRDLANEIVRESRRTDADDFAQESYRAYRTLRSSRPR